ncbi:MAG: DUF721 domain-containing protein [Candidatus Dormibacteria bacterium]
MSKDLERIADLLEPALRGLGVQRRVREEQLRDIFADVVGPILSPMCEVVSLDRGVLLIAVSNTSLSHQLHVDSVRIVSTLNQRLGTHSIRRLRFTTL